MARGRFISNDVIDDKEMNDLSSDTCRLAYVYLITIADREGRVAGDPPYLKSLLFPRRYDIAPDDIREFILEWVEAGFVIWYECSNGEKALRLVNFEKHQRGLRKDREAESKFEDPSYCRILAGDTLKNGNGLKEKIKDKNNKNNNINVNSNSGVGDGSNPELVGSEFTETPQDIKLLNHFKEITLLEPNSLHDEQYWLMEARKWSEMGATEKDITEAINKADKQKTTLGKPSGITSYLRSTIARRKRGVTETASSKKLHSDADKLDPETYKRSWQRQ